MALSRRRLVNDLFAGNYDCLILLEDYRLLTLLFRCIFSNDVDSIVLSVQKLHVHSHEKVDYEAAADGIELAVSDDEIEDIPRVDNYYDLLYDKARVERL